MGGLGCREPRRVSVGAVAQEQSDAVVLGEVSDRSKIGEATVDRCHVEFEIAGVQNHALRRVERGGESVRYRVGHGEELEIEGPDLDTVPVADLDEAGLLVHPSLIDAVLGQPDRERRTDDLERHLAQQVAERPDVILVTVGADHTLDPLRVLA